MKTKIHTRHVFALIFYAVLVALGILTPRSYGQTNPTWVTVHDPRENAFSIQVPKGWKVYGGLFRYGYVDARPDVDMTSQDGKINMRVGDATIPPYTTPGGFAPGQGQRVARYASGDQFAVKYGKARFETMCQSLQMTSSRPMAPRYNAAGQGLIRTTGGEAYFTCTLNGQPMFGYVYSETLLVGSGGAGSNWYVVALGSFFSPLDQAKAVGQMLKHSGESIAFSQAWSKAQQQRVDTATQILRGQTQATISATEKMNAHQQAVIRGQQAENDNFNDVINGVSYTRDTVTGQTHEVQTGTGGTKWVSGNQTVVQSAMQPGPDFHQLENISR